MSSIPYNKIACSLNNSAAIGENGEIYVWGSGKYGITNALDTDSRAVPCNIGLQNINQFYEAIHISCGLYHMAAIVKNSIIDKIDPKREPTEIFRKMIEKQKKAMNVLEIEILKKFEITNYPDGFIPVRIFQAFLQEILPECDYTIEEKRALPDFIYYFCMDAPEKVHILQYYYFINHNENYYSAYIWGVPTNGRLGLSQDQLEANDILKDKKPKKKEEEKTDYLISNPDEESENEEMSPGLKEETKFKKKSKYKRIRPTKIEFFKFDKAENINIAKISCGHHHTMALDEKGILYTWGMGSQGCLGYGQIKEASKPQAINCSIVKATFAFESDHDVKFKDIACGSYHCMALAISEDLYTWGANTRGQLGHGHTNNVMKPKKVEFFAQEKVGILSIAAGDQHSATISSGNELYTWGCGAYYRLGHGLAFDELVPKKVEVLEDVYVKQVSCGVSHTLCITNEGFIYGWGSGMCGKLGIEEKSTKNYILPTRVGTYLGKFRRKAFQEVCAGPLHSFTLTEDGIIYTWGSSKNGILGLDRRAEDVYQPQKIPNIRFAHRNFGRRVLSTIKFENIYFLQQFYGAERILYNERNITVSAVICAAKNTFFLSQDGKLFVAGSNQYGLMVRNPLKNQKIIEEHFQPQKNINVTALAKPKTSNIIMETASLLSSPLKSTIKSPRNAEKDNQLMDKLEKGAKAAPLPIHYFKKKLVFIACSYNHAIAINELGRCYTWGANTDYQLGLGFQSKYEYIPKRLEGALETKVVKMCACSEKFSALLTDLGEVWTFGTSEQGSLGHEEKNSYIIPIPKMINDIPAMTFIACGPEHMMAISAGKNDLYAWGNNIYGQLGVSNPIIHAKEAGNKEKTANDIRVFKPKLISLIIGDYTLKVEMVALGMYHSVILSMDKYLYSCGLKKYAGIPLSDLTQNFEYCDTFSPVLALRNRKFKMITCGEFHTMALSDSNDIFGWGSSLFGRLGEHFWKGGEDFMIETQTQMGGMKKNLAEDAKLIVQPCQLYENKDGNAKRQMRFLACGPTHSAAINRHGEVFTWGSSINGKLGVFKEEYFKGSLAKTEKEDEKESNEKKAKKENFFVMPKLKVKFREKQKKQEEPQNNQSQSRSPFLGFSQKPNMIRKSSPSKNKSIFSDHGGSKKENGDSPGQNHSGEDSEKEAKKEQDSDMLIREESSVESEDLLDLYQDNKAQVPRDSILPGNMTKTSASPIQRKSILPTAPRKSMMLNTAVSQHQSYVSETGRNINLQDPLQKYLFSEKPEMKEERLMAEDDELERTLRVLVERKIKTALSLTKEYNIVLNRIDSVIYARMNILNRSTQNMPFLKTIQHKIPTFVLQNIQLYETLFSFLRLHPCYIMRIISTHLLNNSQVNQLINILYNNPISKQSSICSLISLSKMVFEFEVKNYFKITEIKNFKIGSIFWQIYLILFLKQELNRTFIVNFARQTILETFIKYYTAAENLDQKFKDNERHKLMQKALEFQEEEPEGENFSGESRNKELLKHLKTIVTTVAEKFQDFIRLAMKSKKTFLTKELTYLHSSIIEIYKKCEIQKVEETFHRTNEFEMIREEDKRKYESSLDPLRGKLDKNCEVFIRNLYFGVMIHVIQNYEQFDIQIPKDFQAFVEKSNNLKILSELIEKYFAKEVYADDKKFHILNEVIINQDEADNRAIYRILTEYDYFNLSLNHLVESLSGVYDFQNETYEVSLEFLFILHNLYCKSIKTLNPDSFLLRSPEEDPIWIIFNYLNFEEIPINDYNSDTLRMNINLKTNSNQLLNTHLDQKFQFYRCLSCDILLPRALLDKPHAASIEKFEKEGWTCPKCKRPRNKEYFCSDTSCKTVIPLLIFNYLSIINKYYQEADALQYLFLEVLRNMDFLKLGKDLLGEILENQERSKKKEDHFLVGKINDFLLKMEEIINKNQEPPKNLKDHKHLNQKRNAAICEALRKQGLEVLNIII